MGHTAKQYSRILCLLPVVLAAIVAACGNSTTVLAGTVTINQYSANATVNSHTTGSASVSCPAGTQMTSGGYSTSPGNVPSASYPASLNTWTVTLYNNSVNPVQVTAYAHCVHATYALNLNMQIVQESQALTAGLNAGPVAQCPSGTDVTGNGFQVTDSNNLQVLESTFPGYFSGFSYGTLAVVMAAPGNATTYALCGDAASIHTTVLQHAYTFTTTDDAHPLIGCGDTGLLVGGGFGAATMPDQWPYFEYQDAPDSGFLLWSSSISGLHNPPLTVYAMYAVCATFGSKSPPLPGPTVPIGVPTSTPVNAPSTSTPAPVPPTATTAPRPTATSTTPPAPKCFQVSGSKAEMNIDNAFFALDSGQVSHIAGPNFNLQFTHNSTTYGFAPINGAATADMGAINFATLSCFTLRTQAYNQSFIPATAGDVFAVKLPNGHFGAVQVTAVSGSLVEILWVDYSYS